MTIASPSTVERPQDSPFASAICSPSRRTHLDLFSGIGGFALAAQAAGFQTIGFCEIEPYACKVLEKNWPDVPNYGDIRRLPTIACDVLTGGFPCQPFSTAGKQRGAQDDRFLWPAMLDAISRCKPAWVLGENVPGLVGMELDSVLTDLEGIGFRTQSLIIPACAVDRKHRRDRVWIIANANRERQSPSILGAIQPAKSATAARTRGRKEKWEVAESRPVGVADGLPENMGALKAYGNAIVPKIAEVILREIALVMENDKLTP